MTRDLPIERFRNIGIMAHIDAGKTTVSERILLYSGRIHRAGEVHQGTAKLDHLPEEQDHGITITAAATTAFWTPKSGIQAGQRHRINLIDTPGHVDFTIEVERSLRVLDGAVAVLDGGNGVEAQTITVWRQADKYRVPRVAFVNKLDKLGADFAMCVASLREQLGANAVVVQLPLGEQENHRGVIDLLRMHALVFDEKSEGREFATVPIPAEHSGEAERARARLIEACAEVDELVMAHFANGTTDRLTAADLERALRKGTIALELVPVLCGSAFKNKGIQPLLDAVVAYLPSPADLPPTTGRHPDTGAELRRAAEDDAPVSALAFKLVTDDYGSLTFLRVYSGTLKAGTTLFNATRGKRERVGRLVLLHADEREDIEAAHAGVICAAVGLRDTRTGDTLCDPDHPVVLESLEFPDPVIEVSIEPKTRADQDRLATGLAKVALEDPSFRVGTDPETGQTILRGMGELHLEIVVDRLKREHRVEAVTGRPKVAYRETLAGSATVNYRYIRQSGGGHGQYAIVTLEVAPAERGAGFVFEDATRGGVVPREYVPAVRKGVADAMSRGVLAGYPVTDVVVRLTDGGYHEQDSSTQSFEIAGSLAFQEAAQKAGLQLLEPVMAVEASTPEEYVGDVIGDANARRGQVRGIATRGGSRVVTALVPLATLFGYIMEVRGKTHGRGTASMKFSHYSEVPRSVQEQIVARARGA